MAPQMSNKTIYPYYYRVSSPYLFGKPLAALLKRWNIKRVALVKSFDVQMEITAQDYITELTAAGIEIVTIITVLNSDASAQPRPTFNSYYAELKRKFIAQF
jgi:hypothetical protein